MMTDRNTLIAAGAFVGSVWLVNLLRGLRKRQQSSQPTALNLEVIDFEAFNHRDTDPARYARECEKVAYALHHYGCLVVRDPRVHEEHNNTFLDMLERYFEVSDGKRDARPEHHFQVGVTPANQELPRNHCAKMKNMQGQNQPMSKCPPELDPKWRFFWRIGSRPVTTRFPSLNMEPVVPPEFPEWTSTMNMWGTKMLDALFVLAEMAATGFGMEADAFTSRMQFGPHLLAPTGSDFNTYGQLGKVLAGFHTDLNFMTIHGKSRFPGLYIWLRDGTKVAVRVPDGCLLVQAGKQLEYLTGGYVLPGFHEVVVSPDTVKVIEKRRAEGKSLWRVSSTLFSHIASDQMLQPIGRFASKEAMLQFPPKYTGDQVQDELNAINLGAK